jgi:hypothetical protein
MIIGIIIFMSGLLIIAFLPTPLGLFCGIVVFSTGEFLTHPSFISYTSKIAPKDKVTIYMGYIFIATGIGLVLGSLFGGPLYENIAKNMESPTLFWGIVVSIGLISTFFFIFYNRKYSEERPEVEEVLTEKEIAPKKKGILDMNLTLIMPIVAIPILLIIAQSAGTLTFHELRYEEETEFMLDWDDYDQLPIILDELSGTLNENSNTEEIVEVTHPNIKEITFTLTWQDEPDSSFRHNNMPDEFSIIVKPPNGTEVTSQIQTNPQGGEGEVVVRINIDIPNKAPFHNGTGQYNITIQCHDCGDHEPTVPDILNLRSEADNSNNWRLETTYIYLRRSSV